MLTFAETVVKRKKVRFFFTAVCCRYSFNCIPTTMN